MEGVPFVDYKSHGYAVWFLENELAAALPSGTIVT